MSYNDARIAENEKKLIEWIGAGWQIVVVGGEAILYPDLWRFSYVSSAPVDK